MLLLLFMPCHHDSHPLTSVTSTRMTPLPPHPHASTMTTTSLFAGEIFEHLNAKRKHTLNHFSATDHPSPHLPLPNTPTTSRHPLEACRSTGALPPATATAPLQRMCIPRQRQVTCVM